ncbi:universal stress protein [Roseivirga sp.]|uniref:universal stress protein n=1 Tax=Roseivirga sp. TaxID=1964215 RepID=UPI003B8C54D9
MKKFTKWMVGIDVNKNEVNLLKNVAVLANQFTPDVIHVVYVSKELDIPKEVLVDIPDLMIPDIKQAQTQLNDMVSKCFHAEQPVEIHVLSGNQLTELLKFENSKKIDLAILGRRNMNRVGVLSKKMVRKSACNVMLMPDRHIETVKSILSPLDFSEYSDLALDVINDFQNATLPPVVHALHVYKDATKYLSQVFETADEIDRILSKRTEIDKKLTAYAQHELDAYLEKMKKPYIQKNIASVERGKSVGQPIDQHIDKIRPDLLVMGSKGKTMSAAALLGEVSESILPHNGEHITLILKKNGENKGFLNGLLNLGR